MAKSPAFPSVAAPVDETLKKFSLDPKLTDKSAAQTAGQDAIDEAAALNSDEVDGDSEPFLPVLSEEYQRELYEEAASINAALEALTERKEAIKTIFRALPYGTTTVHPEAGGKVAIGHNSQWNELKFLQAYPYDHSVLEDVIVEKRGRKVVEQQLVYPNRELYKIMPDRVLAKSKLGEDRYREFLIEGEKSVTIK